MNITNENLMRLKMLMLLTTFYYYTFSNAEVKHRFLSYVQHNALKGTQQSIAN
jgi:hypothetical protein